MTAPSTPVLCAPWATFADVPDAQKPLATETEWNIQLTVASEILWALSGRQWSGAGCEASATLRSNPPTPGGPSWPYDPSWGQCGCWLYGTWLDGVLYPARGSAWPGVHVAPVAIQLPHSKVSVTSVTVDGAPFAAWRITRAGWLERTDGRPWQTCDDSTVIDYTYGEPPPIGGVRAALALAAELIQADQPGCRLPARVTSVSRQGLSYEVFNTGDLFPDGRTGLPEVDLWLASVNPQRRARRSTVWSPDLPRTVKT